MNLSLIKTNLITSLVITVLSSLGFAQEASNDPYVYVGSYASENSPGIFVYRMNSTTGDLTLLHKISGVVNPSYLAIDPTCKFLYSVSELGNFQGQKSGGLSAFAINPDNGDLSLLNQQSSLGQAPCYVSVDKTGKWVFNANYSGGNVAVHPILQDGKLGEASDMQQHHGSSINPQRQKAPYAHSIVIDPSNKFAYASDLGIDKIMIYAIDLVNGKLKPNDPPFASVKPGSGPRHFTFHPNGKYAFSIEELSCEIISFKCNAQNGALEQIQTISTLPEGFSGDNSCADIHVSPDGSFLYGSNRGHDSIAIFKVNQQTGELKLIGHESTQGQTPRNFAIDPTGKFLYAANQGSKNIVSFSINPDTGLLKSLKKVSLPSAPVCIKFAIKGNTPSVSNVSSYIHLAAVDANP